MRFYFPAIVVFLTLQAQNSHAFSTSSSFRALIITSSDRSHTNLHATSTAQSSSPAASSSDVPVVVNDSAGTQIIGWKDISSMPYRQLQKHLKARQLDSVGTTAVLRERLHAACGGECVIDDFKAIGNCDDEQMAQLASKGIAYSDVSTQDVDYNELLEEIRQKAEINHWKVATRKLKKLKKNFLRQTIPEDIFLVTLKACMADRLNGARASEPARRIMEDMMDSGYVIPKDMINYCILNSLGDGPDGTHDGCGGIDCALAMMAAASGDDTITEETYGRVATILANSGEVEDAEAMLREMIVDKSMTPQLGIFADIAMATASSNNAPATMNILALAKAAGYQLDNIASTVDGRSLLAAGVIAAEKMDNIALGLRLLTAASEAKGCEPDRGDALVASASSAVQRASTLIHKRAINKAVEDGAWKLAVKLMELMVERNLKPSPAVWKNVVTCCAKNEKSRKATALLLDWVKLAEDGTMTEKPPLRVFNTVVNACEICDEHELTLLVLDAMRKTHETDGNIITFNIALKRLAKLGNVAGCEGIIIGMLQQQVEPTVVSYTTAIAACALEGKKNPMIAYEWMKRMRSRNVMPNVISYNTALAACLDGKLASTMLGSKIATEMLMDVDRQLEEGVKGNVYTTVFPDVYTKTLARQLMKNLRDHWRNNEIDMRVAKATVRKPLLQLVDFTKSDRAAAASVALKAAAIEDDDDDNIDATARDETELEYAATAFLKRTAEV